MLRLTRFVLLCCLALLVACSGGEDEVVYDLILTDGLIYDGSGNLPYRANIAIKDDKIAAIGTLGQAAARQRISVRGHAIAPGFINMLSWANVPLLIDGRAESDIRQGVTLEIFGEGWSMGPWTEEMKAERLRRQGDLKYDIEWTTLGEYLEHLERRGVSVNVGSFVGATTLRIHEIGYEDRKATAEELAAMQELTRQAMRDGAFGVGSSLIYAPANFADTDELVALAEAAGEYGGIYISHIRSESSELLESVDELIEIADRAGVPAEIYHLKASGEPNWGKLYDVFDRVRAARSRNIKITANMYTYPASSTGLNAAMPLWVQEGGHQAWVERLKDPEIRARVVAEMMTPAADGSNRFLEPGPDKILLIGFKSEALKPLIGKTVAQVAAMRGTGLAETAIDLVVEDDSRVDVVYFSMSEDNIRRKVEQDWITFGSDAGAYSAEGVFLKSNVHPRAYGNFARVLGKYSRDEGIIPLEQAIQRLTAQPAENVGIRNRGRIREGFYADLVVFDPDSVRDHATFEDPHRYATGIIHVFVNGEHVLNDGEHTGATPGRVVRGPGWSGWAEADPGPDS